MASAQQADFLSVHAGVAAASAPATVFGKEVSGGVPRRQCSDHRLLCEDRARHAILSIRLRRGYYLYCFVCFLLASALCFSTIGHLLRLKHEGRTILAYQRHAWELALEMVIASAVGTETLSTLWLAGRHAFLRDCWCIFDTSVVLLTLADWCLHLVRWALLAGEMLEMDLPMLALRFVLQPCRVLAAVSMVRRVKQMQDGAIDIAFDLLKTEEDPQTEPVEGRILTKELRTEISAHLPAWCRYRQWSLAYAPHVHGTSFQTFLRRQVGKSANIILLRASDGTVLGGFIPEEWRACAPGSHYYGGGESFVFSSSCTRDRELNGEESGGPSLGTCSFYHAEGHEEVLLWADASSINLSGAISVHADFLSGSTSPSAAFGSPALVKCRTEFEDFIISDFECWHMV